jgi:hypothetical protein
MSDIHDPEFYERVEQNVKRQKRNLRWTAFGLNAAAFLFYVFFLIASQSDPTSPIANIPPQRWEVLVVPLGLWLIVLGVHFGSVWADSGKTDKEMMARAMTQELGQQVMDEALRRSMNKPKRDTSHLDEDYVTINDEGEIVPLNEAENERRSSL